MSRSSHSERLETRDKKGIVSAETTGKRPRRMWFQEKREVCAAISDAARRHNQPPLQDSGFKIIAPLVGHLLNGGYDLALIKRVAVAATLDYDEIRRYSKLFQLRMRVRAEQSRLDLKAHNERLEIERAEIRNSQTLATLADVKRLDPRRPLDERQDVAIDGAERALGFRA